MEGLRRMDAAALEAREARLRRVWERGRETARRRGSVALVRRSRGLDRELAEVRAVREERARRGAAGEGVEA